MNQQAMMRKIRQMQQEMLQTQKEIEETEFKTSVGPVKVVMMGTKIISKIEIDADYRIESDDDREMLEDSLCAANSQLVNEIDKYTEEKMAKYRSLLGGF